MPADTMEKQTASPIAGAPANGSHTPDKPKNASEHRKVRIQRLFSWFFIFEKVVFKPTKGLSAVCKLMRVIAEQSIYVELFLFSFAVFQTDHGKAPQSENKREPGAAQDSHPGRAEKRRKFDLM